MLQIISGGSNSKIPLSFASAQKIYKEEIGESVLLLCKVNNLGKIGKKPAKRGNLYQQQIVLRTL